MKKAVSGALAGRDARAAGGGRPRRGWETGAGVLLSEARRGVRGPGPRVRRAAPQGGLPTPGVLGVFVGPRPAEAGRPGRGPRGAPGGLSGLRVALASLRVPRPRPCHGSVGSGGPVGRLCPQRGRFTRGIACNPRRSARGGSGGRPVPARRPRPGGVQSRAQGHAAGRRRQDPPSSHPLAADPLCPALHGPASPPGPGAEAGRR